MHRSPEPSPLRDDHPDHPVHPAEPAEPAEPAQPAQPELAQTPVDSSRLLDTYQSALVRLVLAVIEGLGRDPKVGISSRRVTNFLRGNQRPPATLSEASLLKLFGALARYPSGWIQEIVRTLIESGEVQEVESAPASTAASGTRRVRLSRWGRKLLRSSRTFSADILPRPPCLGTHPELEARLWELRRRLAAEEGRAPFSVFSNGTLAALATACPRDLGELAEVPGFGEARIRKYGRAVLDVFRSGVSVEGRSQGDASVATASGEKSGLKPSRVQQMQQRVTLHQSSTKRPDEEETGEKAAHVSRPADVSDLAAGAQSVAEDLDSQPDRHPPPHR